MLRNVLEEESVVGRGTDHILSHPSNAVRGHSGGCRQKYKIDIR